MKDRGWSTKNARLKALIAEELQQAKAEYESSGEAARVFRECRYQTLESWSRERRVVGKAEHLSKGANPRFIVSSLPSEEYDARTLYDESLIQYVLGATCDEKIVSEDSRCQC